MVRLLQKIGIEDQTYQDVAQDCHNRAKLFETVSCYAELHISLMAWIFRESSNYSPSEEFSTLLVNTIDRFITPLLGGSALNLLASLQEIIAMSSSVLAGRTPAVRRVDAVTSTFNVRQYGDILRDCLIRRSREFLLFRQQEVELPGSFSCGRNESRGRC